MISDQIKGCVSVHVRDMRLAHRVNLGPSLQIKYGQNILIRTKSRPVPYKDILNLDLLYHFNDTLCLKEAIICS